MIDRTTRLGAAATAAVLLVVAFAGTASALVTDAHIENQVLAHEAFRGVSIEGSDITESSIRKASVANSHVGFAYMRGVSVEGSYLNDLTVEEALLEDTRVEDATVRSSTLRDVTVCDASVNGFFHVGTCHLVTIENGNVDIHARLVEDAPETVSPGDSYDLKVRNADADTLTVTNDPAGLTELGFLDPTAPEGTIESLELRVDGEIVEAFQLGETVDLPDGEFTLRVNLAEQVIDTSLIGLVLNLDGHTLRPAISEVEVVATQLQILPLEEQFMAPFIADAVGRLLVELPTDELGNVDRDVDVSLTRDVLHVEEMEGTTLVGDIDEHVSVHGDSEFLDDTPFEYAQPTSEAAHHPETLEFLVRENVGVESIGFGDLNFHATHIVAIGPSETVVKYTATVENAHGDVLEDSIIIEMPPTPDEERTVTQLGQEFTLPGRATLLTKFVDEDGDPVEAQEGWELVITEGPDQHMITKHVLADGDTEREVLPASALVPLPFGNFIPSDYQVCLHHDGQRDCANDGDPIFLETGETTVVEIVIE